MNLKKIIAREFLFLLSTLVLLGLIFIGAKFYNLTKERKIESLRLETKIEKNNYQRFLLRPLRAKDSILNQNCLNRISAFYKGYSDVESYNVIYKKFPELKSDSILLIASMDYNATINSGKYKSLKEANLKFPEFFIINKAEIDSLNHYKAKIKLLKNKILKSNDNIFTTTDILEHLYVFSIWLVVVLFGLRYIIYTTKWAIRTIKSKE